MDQRDASYIRIQATFDEKYIHGGVPNSMSRENWVHLVGSMSLHEAILRLLVLSELAAPGLLPITSGFVIGHSVGGGAKLTKQPFYSLAEGSQVENAWPAIRSIPFSKVVVWAVKAGYDCEGVASRRVHRALAAYTQCIALTESRLGEVLFRSMQGLEAFYCDGVGDLRKQLDDKSKIWLGKMLPGNMSIGKLYEQRSKVIHGSSSIAYWPEIFEEAPGVKETRSVLTDAASYSFRLLFATLQEAIVKNVHDLSWSYVVVTDA